MKNVVFFIFFLCQYSCAGTLSTNNRKYWWTRKIPLTVCSNITQECHNRTACTTITEIKKKKKDKYRKEIKVVHQSSIERSGKKKQK